MAIRIACDVHTHTLYSRHAYSTLKENVDEARERGLQLLGTTDHFSRMLFPEQHVRNFQYFKNSVVWPREWGGVMILRGAEADIEDCTGRLFGQGVPCPCNILDKPYADDRDLYERVTAGLDYVIASVHDRRFTEGRTLAERTRCYTGALEEPKVAILGHIGRSGVDFDLDEVLAAAKECRKMVEINEHSVSDAPRVLEKCRRIAERCAEEGVGVTVSSDAHICCDVGRFPNVTALLEQIGFPPELVMNRDRASFLGALAAAGVCDVADPREA